MMMFWLLMGLLVVSMIIGYCSHEDGPGITFFVVGLCCWVALFVWRANYNQDVIAENAVEEAAKIAAAYKRQTPHVVREADGCKVYAFEAQDRWHYFTRCANMTTTESSYSVKSGKTTRTETETIVQETAK